MSPTPQAPETEALIGRLVKMRWIPRALLVTAVAVLFLVVDTPTGEANVGDGEDTNWSQLEKPGSTVARRRRRRRRRRRKRRRRRRKRRRRRSKAIKRPRNLKRTPPPARAAAAAPTSPGRAPAAGALRRGARVEFDGRLVQGQTAKSGAIYLFARKRSELRSMVKERKTYRREILRTIYPAVR